MIFNFEGSAGVERMMKNEGVNTVSVYGYVSSLNDLANVKIM
jgi:hypothetical protein